MIEIIPAIDIIDGKCVRLTKGDYDMRKTYFDNPLEMALQMEDVGCQRLHLVDLDGARSKHIVNYRVLATLATKTSLTIDFGGGIKSDDDVRIAFESGAAMVTGGSIAVSAPEVFHNWVGKYGDDRIILGADARNGKISVSGWSEDSDCDIIPFIKSHVESDGIKKVISTDVSSDGMLQGPAVNLYEDIMRAVPEIYLIASGGISEMSDVMDLNEMGVPAVIVGKAIYEHRIALSEIEKLNLERNAG